MIISQTSVEPKQTSTCQTLQVLSISWIPIAQCSRKRLVKWSFQSQKLRGSVQNEGHLIRAPARNCERRGATRRDAVRRCATERTGECVEEREGGTYWNIFLFLHEYAGGKTWKPQTRHGPVETEQLHQLWFHLLPRCLSQRSCRVKQLTMDTLGGWTDLHFVLV